MGENVIQNFLFLLRTSQMQMMERPERPERGFDDAYSVGWSEADPLAEIRQFRTEIQINDTFQHHNKAKQTNKERRTSKIFLFSLYSSWLSFLFLSSSPFRSCVSSALFFSHFFPSLCVDRQTHKKKECCCSSLFFL